MEILNDIRRTFREGSALTRLIYINLALFLGVKLVAVVFYLSGNAIGLTEWFSVPSSFGELATKPWTIVSYMFYHEGFVHLLFNILGLYWFGQLFLERFEGRKLTGVYIFGGLLGAVFYILAYTFLPVFQGSQALLLGASASVFAVLVAIAVYDPNREIHIFFVGKFKLIYLALFYILLSVISISASNPGGNIAHLGGAFWGWFYIFNLKRGRNLGYKPIRFIESLGLIFNRKPRMKVTYSQPPRDDYQYNHMKNTEQQEIDRILEKIKASGYDSLSKQEKETLFRQK